MKKMIFALVALSMFSCVSRKNAEHLQEQRDSLSVVVAQKDSMINSVFVTLNGITENLNAIKSRENILTAAVDNGEIKKSAATQISEDITVIDELLESNRRKIAQLQNTAAKLKAANVEIASLNKLIAELQTQADSRNSEIAALKESLAKMSIEVQDLTARVETQNDTIELLTETRTSEEEEVKSKSDLLSTAYYIVGSQKELIGDHIIYKSGFVGRTLKINENRNLDNFTAVDTRTFDRVEIGHRNVTVVTNHPADSYELLMDDSGAVASLVIRDPARFWELSKVLVISYRSK